MELKDLLDICTNKKRIVCIVGAGGKTSLMYWLAGEAAGRGKKVIVSTTTHILKPDNNYVESFDEVKRLWAEGQYAVIGTEEKNKVSANKDASDGTGLCKLTSINNKEGNDYELCKLTFPSTDVYEFVKKETDLILLEADGSKGIPCKVPADHEPVILNECDLVIAVVGMTALGQKLKEACFRYETDGVWLTRDTKKQDDSNVEEKSVKSSNIEDVINENTVNIINEKVLIDILSSEKGARKSVGNREYYVVLNQCDDEELLSKARSISNVLKTQYNIDSVCCRLKSVN